jgi:hypothetical protein
MMMSQKKTYLLYRIHLTVGEVDRRVVLESVAAPSLHDMLQVARDLAVRSFRDTTERIVDLRIVELDANGDETGREISDTVLIPAIE